MLFLTGRVATSDGSPVPTDAIVERVCNARIRQQVHTSPKGDFSMQLGSIMDSSVDASADGTSQVNLSRKTVDQGIPRRELANCELRASVSGFSSAIVNLVDLNGFLSSVDIGKIVVQRRGKVDGATLSATPYKAPKAAWKAYERGIEAEKKSDFVKARANFEEAVRIYPTYAAALYHLGNLSLKNNQKDQARDSFTRATAADPKYLPPYLSLALLAYNAEIWNEVLKLTGHILNLDPTHDMAGYVLDLDQQGFAQAYFYRAVADYHLQKFAEAEKSAIKAVHLDLPTSFPQVHLLLAQIYTRKLDYQSAINEMRNYLELAPNANDVDAVRQQLVKLQQLNASTTGVKDPA